MNDKIANSSRIMLAVCGISLFIVLITPIWRIDLTAPQYPEGLLLLIYADKLDGNVDIINGLNHYIGMKTLHTDDFIEFKVLPFIISFFAILFIGTAILARRKLVNILLAMFICFGILAMIDFWRWEYDYGHNLDPNAAIIVPGMAYQPPLIGFKQLLNFGAYSIPDIGGWIFIAVGAILLTLVIREGKVKNGSSVYKKKGLVILTGMTVLSACSTAPEPIEIGRDNCSFCKMTISDPRFGADIITAKSKIYKFDDPHCLITFINEEGVKREDIASVYFANFNKPHNLINAEEAHFLQSPSFRSPMNGNIAAFTHRDTLEKAVLSHYGNITTWKDMQK